ncbi:hypothetical protein V6N12_070026 [Hibiscus sabdariffa]|uniref:Auxin efflux carrier n=1 Tax=Hibiscus sabdariffa TaxID=183260 RepID=A0ABR2FFK1_9ROSI
MGFLNLFIVALMPILKVILMTGVGFFIALDRIKLLGPESNRHLNNIVFYVLSPSLAATSLAETVTSQSFMTLWFMPLNLLLAYIFGSMLAWLLIKITKTPTHLQAIVIACCSAGNTGTLPLIMIPAVCEESNNPFGDPSVLTVAASSIELAALLPSMNVDSIPMQPTSFHATTAKMSASKTIMQRMKIITENVDLKKVFAPTAIAAIVGFVVGIASPIRKLLIGNEAPLRVIDSSAYILGEAAIPCMTLIMGANLLRGVKGSEVSTSVIIGIIALRNIFLPMIGKGVVKAALHLGVVASDDKLYQFALMLQFAVPPAISVGTMTQFFQLGQCETSVIMLWTYVVAAFTLTLWSTLFMWILA